MASILLNQIRNTISARQISFFCKQFEENEKNTRKSLDTCICTVLIGLENSIKNNTLYNKTIDSILSTQFYKSVEFDQNNSTPFTLTFEQEGFIPLNLLFNEKRGRISEMISNEIGVKSETAVSLFNFITLLILNHIKNSSLKKAQIENDLETGKKEFLNAIPNGIRVILGYPNHEYDEEIEITNNPLTESKYSNSFLRNLFNKKKPFLN